MDLTKLKEPFPPESVHWRIGATTKDKTKGMALAYIDARDVMERLDEVCGPENWQRRYSHIGTVTVCEVGIHAEGDWIWKADGAGSTDVEAEKGILSDAFKRAAVNWGIGRYLYDFESKWVDIEQRGSSFVITPQAMKALHGPKSGPRPETKGGEHAFWDRDTYQLTADARLDQWTPDKWGKWAAQLGRAVKNCPLELDKLTKLQVDNTNHINAFADVDEEAHKAIMDAFADKARMLSQEPVK